MSQDMAAEGGVLAQDSAARDEVFERLVAPVRRALQHGRRVTVVAVAYEAQGEDTGRCLLYRQDHDFPADQLPLAGVLLGADIVKGLAAQAPAPLVNAEPRKPMVDLLGLTD